MRTRSCPIASATIAGTPTSSAANSPTTRACGPTSARRPGPKDPDDSQAMPPVRSPATIPVASPAAARSSALSSAPSARTSRGRRSPPAANPASTGTRTQSSPKVWPDAGSAPNTGSAGIGPRVVPIGETVDPVPIAKPGPTSHDVAQPMKSGRKASWPTVSATPADDLGVRALVQGDDLGERPEQQEPDDDAGDGDDGRGRSGAGTESEAGDGAPDLGDAVELVEHATR